MGEKQVNELVGELLTLDDADYLLAHDTSDGETKKIRSDNARASLVTAQHAYDGGPTINAATAPLTITRTGAGNIALLHAVQTGVDAGSPIARFEGDHAGAHVAVLTPSGTTQDGVRISDGAVTARYGPGGILGDVPGFVVEGAPSVGAAAAGGVVLIGGESPFGATGDPGLSIVRGGQVLSDVDAASIKGAKVSIISGDAIDVSAAGGTAEGGDVEIDTGTASSDNGATADGTIRIGTANAAAIRVGRSGVTAAVLGDLSVAGMLTAPTGQTVSVVGDKAADDAIVVNASNAAGGTKLQVAGVDVVEVTSQGLGLGVDGSAAAQAIYRIGDPDTGLRFPGANQVALEAEGAGSFSGVRVTQNSVAFYTENAERLFVGTSACLFSFPIVPDGNGTRDIGSTSKDWRNIYSRELYSRKLVTKTTASGYAGSDARLETANAQTTDATATDLWTRQLSPNEMLSAQILVQGHKADDGWASYVIHTVWYCTGPGDASLLHSTEINAYESAGASGWGVTLGLGGAGDVARIQVTGAAASTIHWQATVLASAVITSA